MKSHNLKNSEIQSQLPNKDESSAFSHQIFYSYESDLSESLDDSIQTTHKKENTLPHEQIDQPQNKKENRFSDNSNNNDSDTQIYDYESSSAVFYSCFNRREIPKKDACIQTYPQNIIYLGPIPEEEEFKITYKRSNSRWKTQVHVYQNDNLLFSTKSVKDKIMGKMHIVNFNNLMNANYANSGIIVRRSKGTMFTLYENYNTIISNNRQLAGFAFYTELKDKKYRKINLAIPIYDCTIINDEKELSKIALEGEGCQHVIVFSSSIKNESYPIKSKKNFTIYDNFVVPIFRFYKLSKKVFKVKFRPPLTHLIAYSICIAILSSHHL